MSERIVNRSKDLLEILDLEVEVSAADLPYRDERSRPPSQSDFTVYADTIRLKNNYLMNPGRSITLVAREIEVLPMVIDVAGASPAISHVPGALPEQLKHNYGDPGADGVEGSDGTNGGSVTIIAERFTTNYVVGDNALIDGSRSVHSKLVRGFMKHLHRYVSKAIDLPDDDDGSHFYPFGKNGELRGLYSMGLDEFKALGSRQLRLKLHFPKLQYKGDDAFGQGATIFSERFSASITIVARKYAWKQSHDIEVVMSTDKIPCHATTRIDGHDKTVQLPPVVSSIFVPVLEKLSIEKIIECAWQQVSWTRSREGVIDIRAQGGEGGRGQDGGNGIAGEKGADGRDTRDEALEDLHGNIHFPEVAIGKDGTDGGKAGEPGKSGNGGDAGNVHIKLVEPYKGSIRIFTDGGAGGMPSFPGNPGEGGYGGEGGYAVFVPIEPFSTKEVLQAPNGNDGKRGEDASHKGSHGASGKDGQMVINNEADPIFTRVKQGDHGLIAAHFPLDLLLMQERRATVDFLNAKTEADLAKVRRAYQWIADITKPFVDQNPPENSFSSHDIDVRCKLNAIARTEFARLDQGLDYFGHVLDWVPVLSLKRLNESLDRILPIARDVENKRQQYHQKEADQAQQLQKVDDVIAASKQRIDLAENEIAHLEAEIKSASHAADESLLAMTTQKHRILDDEFEFKEALIKYTIDQAVDCSFLDVMEAIVNIVQIAGEAWSGVGAGKAAKDAFKTAGDTFEGAEKLVKAIKAANSTVKELKSAWDSVRDFTNKEPESAKIAVSKEEFDKFIDEYLGNFPEADQLNKAVYQLFDLIDAHNKIMLGYTGLWIEKFRMEQQIAFERAKLEKVAVDRAALKGEAVPAAYGRFIDDAYFDIKKSILLKMYEINRSYEYWALKKRTFSVVDDDVASLGTTLVKWNQDIDDFQSESGATQIFHQEITIDANDYPDGFLSLERTGKLTFNFDIAANYERYFLNKTHLTVEEFTIELPNIQSDSDIAYMRLVHGGTSAKNSEVDLSAEGCVHRFSHNQRAIKFQIDYKNPENYGIGVIGDREQGFPGLSPFTVWTLDFTEKGNEWIDFSAIKSVKFKLKISYR